MKRLSFSIDDAVMCEGMSRLFFAFQRKNRWKSTLHRKPEKTVRQNRASPPDGIRGLISAVPSGPLLLYLRLPGTCPSAHGFASVRHAGLFSAAAGAAHITAVRADCRSSFLHGVFERRLERFRLSAISIHHLSPWRLSFLAASG